MGHEGDLEDLGEAFGEVGSHKLFPEGEEMGKNHQDLGEVGGKTAPKRGKTQQKWEKLSQEGKERRRGKYKPPQNQERDKSSENGTKKKNSNGAK